MKHLKPLMLEKDPVTGSKTLDSCWSPESVKKLERLQEQLTTEERTNFLEELKYNGKFSDKCLAAVSLLHGFLDQALIWNRTAQGFSYWAEIYERLQKEEEEENEYRPY